MTRLFLSLLLLLFAFANVDAQNPKWEEEQKKKFSEKPIYVIHKGEEPQYVILKSSSLSKTGYLIKSTSDTTSRQIIKNDLTKAKQKPIAFGVENDTITCLYARIEPFKGYLDLYKVYYTTELDSIRTDSLMRISDFTLPTFFKPLIAVSPNGNYTTIVYNAKRRRIVQTFDKAYDLVSTYEYEELSTKDGKVRKIHAEVNDKGESYVVYQRSSSKINDKSFEHYVLKTNLKGKVWSHVIASSKGNIHISPHLEISEDKIRVVSLVKEKRTTETYTHLKSHELDPEKGTLLNEHIIVLPKTIERVNLEGEKSSIKFKGEIEIKDVQCESGNCKVYAEKYDVDDDGSQTFYVKKELIIFSLSNKELAWSKAIEKYIRGKDSDRKAGFVITERNEPQDIYYNTTGKGGYKFIKASISPSGEITFSELGDKKSMSGKVTFDLDASNNSHYLLDVSDLKYRIAKLN